MSEAPDHPPIDLSRLMRACGDLGAVLGLLSIFVEQTVEKLRSLESALSAGDYAQLLEDAHSIKGSSANVGADRLRELAGSLEASMKNGEHARAEALVSEVAAEFQNVRNYLEEQQRRTAT